MISKSAENIGKSAEYTVKSVEISKNICRNLNLVSKILNNGLYTEKIFCRLKYILGNRIPGYTTISRSEEHRWFDDKLNRLYLILNILDFVLIHGKGKRHSFLLPGKSLKLGEGKQESLFIR